MKLQFKIFLLLSIIFGILILSFLSYQYLRIRQDKLFYLENAKTEELVIDKVLQLNRIKYEQLINDNSGWDDMVHFAAKPDREWAKDNVDFFVNSFNLSFILVYNKEMNLVYQFGDSSCLKNLIFPDPKMIQSSFSTSAFTRQFQLCGNNLMEIFGASIVPAFDTDTRKTPNQGYLFVGKKWNKEYLSEHAEATNYKVELMMGEELNTFPKNPKNSYFIRPLMDSTGKIIGNLVFSKEDPLKEGMNVFLYLSFMVTLIAFTAMIVFLFYFRKIILVPLTKISTTLNTHNPQHLYSLSSSTEEFQNIKSLVLQFFGQQESLKNKNSELQESNATKDKLFSIIAHDLKNPVGSILILSELLEDDIKNQDQESATELLGMIESQAKETLALLETLFDWAKSQTGQMSFNPEILNVKETLEFVLPNLYSSAALKNITIESVQSDELMVFADPNLFHTILRNLITNAIKFTKPWGNICISAEMNHYYTQITITDNGIGMSQETLNKLFRIDTNLNLTTQGTANEKGTGLGLIICKEFIEKHGGNIQVTSKLDKGSQFKIILPFKKTEKFD